MAIAKVAGLIVAVAGIATVGTIAMVSSSPTPMPEWRPASDDTNESTEYGENKYAKKYKRYLAGVGDSPNGKINNAKWWIWSFDNRYTPSKKENDKSGFKDVSSPTTLETACKNAYKAQTSNIKTGTETATTNTDYKESDIWKYCSPIGQKPSLIKDRENSDGYQDTTIGGKSGNKDKIVSVKDSNNDLFWKIRQEEFFADSGSFSAKTDTTNKFFEAFYKSKDTNPLALKAKCEGAYTEAHSTQDTDGSKPTETGVLKYCTLEGSN